MCRCPLRVFDSGAGGLIMGKTVTSEFAAQRLEKTESPQSYPLASGLVQRLCGGDRLYGPRRIWHANGRVYRAARRILWMYRLQTDLWRLQPARRA